jgi:hypothetical protein
MENVSIIWVEDNKTQSVHAALFGKAYTFCQSEYHKEMKFKSLNDFSHYDKCPKCTKIVHNIYQGIM